MPIEIRELVIKATIVQEGATGASTAPSSSSNNNVSANEEIITACVEKILEIINDRNDR
jgi:hypothetical protein